MELIITLINGLMLGVEYVNEEEEGFTAVVVDFLFFRFMFISEIE